jgi:hypothetical protein
MMEEKKTQLEWIDDPKMWRNIRGGALAIILLISPLVYFGIIDNLSMDKFLSYELGGLVIFMTLMNLLSVVESRTRAFEDELEFDNSIITDEKTIDDNAEIIRPNISSGIVVLSKHNKKLQQSYDEQKTTLIIDKKKSKIDRYRIKDIYAKFWFTKRHYVKRIDKLEKKIEKLNTVPKRDRRFKPYRFDRLLTSENISKYKRVGDKETKSNPKKIPVVGAILKMPIKGFSMALGGMFVALFLVDDWTALFKFYLWFIAIISFTIISQYIITRYKTKVQYKKSLKIKIHLQEIVIEGIKEPAPQVLLNKPTCTLCSSELVDYKGVMLICSNESCLERATAIQNYNNNQKEKEA